MCRLRNIIATLVSVAVFSPYPTWEHFIWPLSNCVLADICNHTWIPECAFDNGTKFKKLFIDECDMWEYNCDKSKNYVLVNYSSCFEYSAMPNCPTLASGVQRRGDYKYILEGRKMIYAPTSPSYLPQTNYHATFIPVTTRPNLPSIMFHGKRRHTPEAKKKKKMMRRTQSMTTRKPTTAKLLTQKRTMVLKNITVIKNGKMMLKIIKGVAPETSQDSNFIQ